MLTTYLIAVSFFGLIIFYFASIAGIGDLINWLLEPELGRYACWPSLFGSAIAAGALWILHWKRLYVKGYQKEPVKLKAIRFQAVFITALTAWGLYIHGSGVLAAVFNLLIDGRSAWSVRDMLSALPAFLLTLWLWLFHFTIFNEAYLPTGKKVRSG